MATPETPKSPTLKRNKNCTPDQEINILLLGQTGVGKTTFINAFTNYLVYDTLEEAMKGEMQVPIPSSFSFTDPETFEQRLITVGNEKNREKVNENGQSGTEQCRSFVFPIGKQRNLRLIDTPGMGDTRGSEQDNKNLFEILTYISHYEHLNGICIFLKPNEERLTISFRLCIKQILHYLNERVNENIIFIFTNARSTFFMPGSSKKLLQVLLNEYRDKNDVEVPFKKDNTFLLDNELFHCLALHKNGIKINSEQLESYKKNWDHAIKEYERLLTYVFGRSRHVVGNELSVNGAEQLIRKLRRPIAEILRLIQQNIQMAGEYRQKLSKNSQNSSHGFYQNAVQIVPFEHPRLVCCSKKCLQIVNSNNGEKKPFYSICEKVCYLNGVMQEAISDPRMAQCDIFDKQTGKCTKCDCSWEYHMNMTYEYDTNLVSFKSDKKKEDQTLLNVIDQHINDLQKEQAEIEDILNKMSKFLHVNAILPLNDDNVQYLRFFIREEQMKHEAGTRNNAVFDGLSTIITNYEDNMDAFKKTLTNRNASSNAKDIPNAADVYALFGNLRRLSINKELFRHSVDLIDRSANEAVRQTEKSVRLPEKAAKSTLMCTLKDIVSPIKSEKL